VARRAEGGPAGDRGWRAIFWTGLAPGAAFTLGALLVPESPRWRPDRAWAGKAAPPRPGHRQVAPLLLAWAVMVGNQAVGTNTILAYDVLLLRWAGLPGAAAHAGDLAVKAANLLATLAAVFLVDRLGRRLLLLLGCAGGCACLALAGALFLGAGPALAAPARGWLAVGCLAGFMACFAVGPGVCAWLALSELLPARIRARGMGVGLVLNQLVATALAAAFLPTAARFGAGPLLLAWAAAGAGYFLLVLRCLPETRGRSLEQIEAGCR